LLFQEDLKSGKKELALLEDKERQLAQKIRTLNSKLRAEQDEVKVVFVQLHMYVHMYMVRCTFVGIIGMLFLHTFAIAQMHVHVYSTQIHRYTDTVHSNSGIYILTTYTYHKEKKTLKIRI